MLLAYVFWHWKNAKVTSDEYELRQREFHTALAVERAPGYLQSFTNGVQRLSWTPDGAIVYEDWYMVSDFAALGSLNEAAISSTRSRPHDAAAEFVAGGTGGVYGLRLGIPIRMPLFARWFAKPAGMPYRELFATLAPIVEAHQAVLWMRQMVLGPAREFCLQSTITVELPSCFDSLAVILRPIYPDRGIA